MPKVVSRLWWKSEKGAHHGVARVTATPRFFSPHVTAR